MVIIGANATGPASINMGITTQLAYIPPSDGGSGSNNTTPGDNNNGGSSEEDDEEDDYTVLIIFSILIVILLGAGLCMWCGIREQEKMMNKGLPEDMGAEMKMKQAAFMNREVYLSMYSPAQKIQYEEVRAKESGNSKVNQLHGDS